jgi:hypothetical protein
VLWEHWSKLDDDEEIRIGTVRVEGDPTDIKRVSLSFSRMLNEGHGSIWLTTVL